MGKIYLIPDHHLFQNVSKRTEFTVEMLDWPITVQSSESMYKNALASFMSLSDRFTLVMCLFVDTKAKILKYQYRCWGELYFDNISLRPFSHDTRYDNNPFTGLGQWVEIDDDSVLDWSLNQWRIFWHDCIEKRTRDDLVEAKGFLRRSQKSFVDAALGLDQQKKLTTAILAAVE